MCNDPVIREWLYTLNPRSNTEKNYSLAIKHFTELTVETPEELLTEAEQEVKYGKLMRQCNIKKYLIGFSKYSDEIMQYKESL